jgi:cell division GTPase FtsZ
MNPNPYHIIGLGGAGSNMALYFHSRGVKARYTLISNPERKGLPPDVDFIRFVPPALPGPIHGLSDMNVPLVLPEAISRKFGGGERYILVCGLGGYTGTYMMQELTALFTAKGYEFRAFCCLPFAFESPRRGMALGWAGRYVRRKEFTFFDMDDLKAEYGNLPLEGAFERIHERLLNSAKLS